MFGLPRSQEEGQRVDPALETTSHSPPSAPEAPAAAPIPLPVQSFPSPASLSPSPTSSSLPLFYSSNRPSLFSHPLCLLLPLPGTLFHKHFTRLAPSQLSGLSHVCPPQNRPPGPPQVNHPSPAPTAPSQSHRPTLFSFLETVLFVSLSQSQLSPQCPGPQ